MLDQKIISKKNQIKWYEKIKKDKNSKFFSIYYKNKIIGSGSLTNLDKQNKNCTWGFYIFNKYLGYFGVLAQYKIIQYAFKKYNFHKIYGKTLSTNYQILKIHRKFGFRIEGTLKEQIFIKKKKIDIVLTALYKRDWIKNKKKIRLIFT
jgi:RimJ/RimL family protein N-acetyltransferase